MHGKYTETGRRMRVEVTAGSATGGRGAAGIMIECTLEGPAKGNPPMAPACRAASAVAVIRAVCCQPSDCHAGGGAGGGSHRLARSPLAALHLIDAGFYQHPACKLAHGPKAKCCQQRLTRRHEWPARGARRPPGARPCSEESRATPGVRTRLPCFSRSTHVRPAPAPVVCSKTRFRVGRVARRSPVLIAAPDQLGKQANLRAALATWSLSTPLPPQFASGPGLVVPRTWNLSRRHRRRRRQRLRPHGDG